MDLLRTQRSYAQGSREALGLEGGERRLRAAMGKRRRRYRRGEGSAVVLLYHRIAELDPDPWQLGVGRERFAQQLAVLRERFEVVPLTELVTHIGKGGLPRRGVAVSFDDGYSDNLEAALPELEAAGVPAALYLAQGALDSTRELWWDELERILLAPGTLPQKLVLAAGSWRFAYDLGDAAKLSPAVARAAFNWHVGTAPPTRRHDAFAALWESLWPLDESTRNTAMDQLRGWSGDPGGVRETHRTLRLEDIAKLAQGETFELGGHTITHPRLSARGWEEQRDEIAAGKTQLEELIGRPVRSFAYPYGGLDDFTAATVDLVAESGFTSACATWEGVVNAASDPWRVPRFQVPDVDGDAFGEWLEAKFDAGR
jgi:peptidoglycan/xylan/chitin deacetylase (PgdA/CDA1 family)